MSPEKPASIRVPLMEGQQFLVRDPGCAWTTHLDEFHTGDALAAHVAVGGGCAMIVMAAGEFATDVPVEIRMSSASPEENFAPSANHVVEVSLRSDSGSLQIGQGDEDDPVVELPSAGTFRVRVTMMDLATAEDEEPALRHLLELWPAPAAASRVLEWWEPWRPPPAPPPPTDGRRVIYGHDEFQRALRELSLVQIAVREVEPTPEQRKVLPPSYMESRMLFRGSDGCLWEYATEAPHHLPRLTELAPDEASALFEL